MKKGWKRVFIGFSLMSIITALMICFVNFCIYLGPNYPLYHPEQIIVNDRYENESYRTLFFNEGKYLELEKMSPYLPKALVASEDKRFYQHHGIDYLRVLKSAWNNLTQGKIVQGGSTITQQYARTLFLSNAKSWSRKLQELWVARKMEMTMSKAQILEGYLNCAYFGHNLYGVDQASHYFFAKEAEDLSLSEAAMLIGIMSAPSYYSPEVDLDLAHAKKRQVLKAMYEQNMIDHLLYQQALDEKLVFSFNLPEILTKHSKYYHDALQHQLEKNGLLTNSLRHLGLTITASLDSDIQSTIEAIVNAHRFASEISIVVMKPYSGDVLALIGGKDYHESPYNRAYQSQRQTGSAIKPLLYYLALANGMTPLSRMRSEPTTFYIDGVGAYAPKNAGEQYAYRDITMLEAIALSDNVYATKTLLLLGSSRLQSLLKQFGISHANADPTIGLGTNEMSPLQLTAIYNCLASEGAYYAPRFFSLVQTETGMPLYRSANQPLFQLDRTSVLQLNYLLRSPFDRALSSYATPSMVGYEPTKRFAVKTGTTDYDRWVIGYNPYYTIGIWLGHDDNAPFHDGAIAKVLFQAIANALMKRREDHYYRPDNLLPFRLQNASGQVSNTYYYEK